MKPTNSDLIGSIRSSRLPYFDTASQQMKYKSRPILILSVENERGQTDLTAIPLSKISDKRRIISDYDVKIERQVYPLLRLNESISYFRTSKVTTIHSNNIGVGEISNVKKIYPDLFNDIIKKVKKYVDGIG